MPSTRCGQTGFFIYKLGKQNIKEPIIQIIKSYLTDRQIQLKIQNKISRKFNTQAGVPQASVVELFINEIPKFQKTKTAIYADDTALYAHSFYAQAAQLQN